MRLYKLLLITLLLFSSLTLTAQTYSVNLTWDAPTSSTDPVAGYNIYRSPSGQSTYQLMGTVVSTVLAYNDTSNIQDGQAYDYIVESVDASGNLSAPSNVAVVVIPSMTLTPPSNFDGILAESMIQSNILYISGD